MEMDLELFEGVAGFARDGTGSLLYLAMHALSIEAECCSIARGECYA